MSEVCALGIANCIFHGHYFAGYGPVLQQCPQCVFQPNDPTPAPRRRPPLPSLRDLAQALCDSSSHMNTLPHAEQRPCAYHMDRARDTLKQLERMWEATR